MKLSNDMSDFISPEEKQRDPYAEIKEVYYYFRDEVGKNQLAWRKRRVRGQQRVQRYQQLYGGKRPF
jgi:hypothetical protein